MLVIPNFQHQSASLLQEEYPETSVVGLGENLTHASLAIKKISGFLDIPEKSVKQVASEIKFPGVQEAILKISNRIMIETEFGRAGILGPKWAAIQYGITAQSLINILDYVANRSALSLFMEAEQTLQAFRKHGIIDNLKTKYIVDRFLQSQDAIIFTSSTDRSTYLKNLCEENNIECDLILDAHVQWTRSVRGSLQKAPRDMTQDTATTFCAFTGLPIAHFRSEYSSQIKPGILAPDSISWLALIENASLQKFCALADRKRLDEYIMFTFL